MSKKFLSLAVMTLMLLSLFAMGCGSSNDTKSAVNKELVIYTSMKETLIGALVEGFKEEHPEVEVEYTIAGAGKLMKKISEEKKEGKILADVIWTSEITDFYEMKSSGLLAKYEPSVFHEVLNPFHDYEGYFAAARLGTLGIVINTDKVKKSPASWEEIAVSDTYNKSFGIADPALSGTAFMSIALLKKQFGWGYIELLGKNGAVKVDGSGKVVDLTETGELKACLSVDYIAAGKIDKGAHLSIIYPDEMLVVPSPIAIFKDSKNMDTAKLFVEYMLGKKAQQIIANAGTVPVRTDVKIPEKYNLPTPTEALGNGIRVDYLDVLYHKSEILKKFSQLFDR